MMKRLSSAFWRYVAWPATIGVAVVAFGGCGNDVTVPREMAKAKSAQAAVMELYSKPVADAVSSSAPSAAPPGAMSASPATADIGATSAAAIVAPSMVIRNGTASIEVDSLDAAIAAVQRLASALGGYVGNTSLQSGAFAVRSAQLELKIPSARYDEALTGLSPIGKVETQTSTAEDVGEEFVDVTARQNNAHKLEERLITLLATRTGKLEDVLAVERELARVREEIERYEGRLRYLKSHVATSTLVITVHEKKPVVSQYEGQNVIVESFKNAWRIFVGFIAGLISSLGWVIPLGAIVAVMAMLAKRWSVFGNRDNTSIRKPGIKPDDKQ